MDDVRELRTELDALETESRKLDWTASERHDHIQRTNEFCDMFLDGLDRSMAYHGIEGAPVDPTIPEEPVDLADVLTEFDRAVLGRGLNPTSGRFFGYVPGGGVPSAACGDYLAALTNRYAGVHPASPGGAEIENAVVRWMCDIIGYPAAAFGTLQSGGSLAILTALVAARTSRASDVWSQSVLYATEESHAATDRAIRICGLDHAHRRIVAVDDHHRMRPDSLAQLIARDRREGLSPWMVFASLGTVNTGAIDPLDAIADLAERHDLWMQVDGAYGGFFYLLEEIKQQCNGLNRADAVILDPHKGLFQPYGIGAALVRDGEVLRRAFAYQPDYLADVAEQGTASPVDYSPELTRHFRGLRLWLSLKLHGVERFRVTLREKLMLASYAQARLSEVPGIATGLEPQLSCVILRATAGDGHTQQLLLRLQDRGHVLLSSTRIDGVLWLRMCILCFRSHRADVDTAISELRACMNEILRHA
jgi:glutamate/tyrosine decarboxylase-like PLP-dependent enzyme